jgi:hypothetical protein
MYIPITIAALASLTAAMILLRIFWLRLPSRLRFFLIRASIAVIALHVLFVLTKWTTTSDRLNTVINWLAVAGYALLILLFSRLSPRWLTIPSMVILLLPIFAASIVFPLARLFEPGSPRNIPIGNHLFYEVSPWSNAAAGSNAGVDVFIYYIPPFAPFLRHKLQVIPYNDGECNAGATSVTLLPSRKAVLGHCPRWPNQPPAGTVDKLLPLS